MSDVSKTKEYPLGQHRIPSVGIVLCAVNVITLNAANIGQIAQSLYSPSEGQPPAIFSKESILVIAIFGSGLAFKLTMWLYIQLFLINRNMCSFLPMRVLKLSAFIGQVCRPGYAV